MLGHGVVVQTCLLSAQETEAELRLLGVQGQPDLCGKFQASQRYTVRFKKKKKVMSNARHNSFNNHSRTFCNLYPR